MAEERREDDENIDGLSHPEVMSLFYEKLMEIVSDPLLAGLPNEPTLDEVNSQIALEHGRAIIVNVRQQDEKKTLLRKEICNTKALRTKIIFLIQSSCRMPSHFRPLYLPCRNVLESRNKTRATFVIL